MPLPQILNPLLPKTLEYLQKEKPAKGTFQGKRNKKKRDEQKNKPQQKQKDTMLLKTGGKVSKGGAPHNKLY